jgi:flavin reductase (DIM6/NTAB) family NADH-FMN oxidoreductase RutF
MSTMVEPNARAMRDVLGCYATGVAVLTTRNGAGQHVAVTVNSFSSVSLDPPLVLFSLARRANVIAAFAAADCFGISVLGVHQQAISNMFAKPSTAGWADAPFTIGANGCALFCNSLAGLECRKWAENDGGDHVTFVGEVTHLHPRSAAEPLVFFRGRYGSVTSDPGSSAPALDGLLVDCVVPGWG